MTIAGVSRSKPEEPCETALASAKKTFMKKETIRYIPPVLSPSHPDYRPPGPRRGWRNVSAEPKDGKRITTLQLIPL